MVKGYSGTQASTSILSPVSSNWNQDSTFLQKPVGPPNLNFDFLTAYLPTRKPKWRFHDSGGRGHINWLWQGGPESHSVGWRKGGRCGIDKDQSSLMQTLERPLSPVHAMVLSPNAFCVLVVLDGTINPAPGADHCVCHVEFCRKINDTLTPLVI